MWKFIAGTSKESLFGCVLREDLLNLSRKPGALLLFRVSMQIAVQSWTEGDAKNVLHYGCMLAIFCTHYSTDRARLSCLKQEDSCSVHTDHVFCNV